MWQDRVGNFGTTLLLECDGLGSTFRERAMVLQQRMMDDLPHCWVSGVAVARRTRAGAATAASPFVFASGLDSPTGDTVPPHVLAAGWDLVFKSMHTPQVLLDHQVSEEDGELVCTFDHVADAFPDGMIAELATAHAALLRLLATEEATWSASAPPPLPAELLAARRAANRTGHQFRDGGVLDGLAAGGDRIAFHGQDGKLTYRQATAAVKTMAAILSDQRSATCELVGVLARKSLGQYLASLAVVASGNVYVPLGIDWPAARIQELLVNHGIDRVMVDDAGARLLAGLDRPVTTIAIDINGTEDDVSPLPVPDPRALAYVIFTSGSTGAPKGVAIPHLGLRNTIQDMVDRFGLGKDDRVLSLSELHFDLSAFDLFGGIHCGGTVVVPPCGPSPDPELWEQWLRSSGATVWNTVPALLEMLLDHAGDRAACVLSGLRLILLSGDWIPLDLPDRVTRANPKATVVGLGGATEASIWSNYHVIDGIEPGWKSVPYGQPLANQRYHVLDDSFHDQPHWVPGELFIAGAGIAASYYGQPELTADRFPRHPATGERLYRTGDSGRYRPNGTLEFLGRRDSQVKVRGYRVDLLEVERHLARQPGVRAVVCVVVGTGAASRLIACCVVEEGCRLDPVALREGLLATLPKYCVPSVFRSVPALPLTPNGKRDAKALLAIACVTDELTAVRSASWRPPATARERTLVSLWEQVCQAPVESVDVDFFAVGGTSITAVRLLGLIEREYGVRLPLSSLFEASTVAAQAALLDSHQHQLLVTIRSAGSQRMILVHPVGGHLLGYRDLVDALPDRFSVYGLQSPPVGRLPGSLADLADLHTQALSTVSGPLHLLGWSMGGVLATEIARRLMAIGAAPHSLTLVDSFVGMPGTARLDEATAAAGFFADYVGQSDPATAVHIAPPGEPDPFGYLAERHLPGHSVAALRESYDQYRALNRLLLAHSPRRLPRLASTLVVTATNQRADAFPGLLPIRRHPGDLVPDDVEFAALPETHYSVVRAAAASTIVRLLPEGTHD